jgi:pimeloyl-ACP methyl ester carboxylesterase
MRPAAALVLILAVGCGGGGKSADDGETAGPPVREQNVTFRTSDGLTLTGKLFGAGRVGVVLAHMFPADASSWYPTARTLARDGYLALAFNFRGYDGSQGTKSTTNAPVDL